MKSQSFLRQMIHVLISPSDQITEPDRRRQAALLSALLLGLLGISIAVQGLYSTALKQPSSAYGEILRMAAVLLVTYGISRTRYVQLAATLAMLSCSLALFSTILSHPESLLGGLFDYVSIPLWLASFYLNTGGLILLVMAELAGLLLLPSLTPAIRLIDVLVGPFSFVIGTSLILIIMTRHRDLLELDRKTELMEKERYSRREAARAEALLRMAERLNSQLDLEALMDAITEDVSRAIHTPISLIALYNPKEDAFISTAVNGMPTELVRDMEAFPRALYDQTVQKLGMTFRLSDLQTYPHLPNWDLFKRLNLRSLAFATMKYENELIGSLVTMTAGATRDFSPDELLLLQGVADQAALAINNTRLYKDAQRRLNHLQALRAIDIAIASNQNLHDTMNVLLDQIMQQLQVDAVAILVLDEARQKLEFGLNRGFRTSSLQYTSLAVGEGLAGRAVQQRRTILVRNLQMDLESLANAASLAQEHFVSYCAVPLMTQGQVKGVLEIFQRSPLNPEEEWLAFLETLAGQAAIAIEHSNLFEDLQRTNEELLRAYDATIEGWSHALDLRDRETEGHTQRVTELTLELSRAFGFSEREMIYIRWGALLHDIGKMGVPDRILLKPGPLNEEEWKIMRLHPVYAHEMLRTIQYLRPALDIPYCHHEKWDGTGYPRGLKANEIPLLARLFAVVDVWDALTSHRPYRTASSREQALAYIRESSGSHFDPQVVEIFMTIMEKDLRLPALADSAQDPVLECPA